LRHWPDAYPLNTEIWVQIIILWLRKVFKTFKPAKFQNIKSCDSFNVA